MKGFWIVALAGLLASAVVSLELTQSEPASSSKEILIVEVFG